MSTARVDLVCEGGGVRGIGLVGAVDALGEAGYRFPRVAGTSAGAIVASLVAALQVAGESLSRLAEIMRGIDYRKFLDRNLIGHVPLIGRASRCWRPTVCTGGLFRTAAGRLARQVRCAHLQRLAHRRRARTVRLVAGGGRQ